MIRSQNQPENVISTSAIKELRDFSFNGKQLEVGCGLSLAEVSCLLADIDDKASFIEAFSVALDSVGSAQIRNVATVAGSILWGHPSSDLLPVYQSGQATVNILKRNGEIDNIKLGEPFPTSCLLLSIKLQMPQPNVKCGFFKLGKRQSFDLSLVNAFLQLDMDENLLIKSITIIHGGGDTDIPIKKTCQLRKCWKGFEGEALHDISLNKVKKTVEQFTSNEREASVLSSFIYGFICQEGDDKKKRTPPMSELSYMKMNEEGSVHRPIPHISGKDQAKGFAGFLNDVKPLADELKLVLIRSKKAKATIQGIDFSKAIKVSGVIGVLTQHDIGEGRNFYGNVEKVESVLSGDEVCYQGQVIAAIACETKQVGEEASKLVKITYEDSEMPILSLDQAIAEESFHGTPYSMQHKKDLKLEADDEQFEIKGGIRIGGQEHFYLEPNGALAIPSKEKDEMIVYCGTQNVSNVHSNIAFVTGIDQNKIVVKCKRMGGAFGGKEKNIEAILASLAAKKFGRSVRCVLSRSEDMDLHGPRHEIQINHQVSFNQKGKITKLDLDCFANAGATRDESMPWIANVLWRCDGGYTLYDFEGRISACKTNTNSKAGMRGYGGPEGMLAMENIMERIAFEIGVDPLEVRLENLTREGDFSHCGETQVRGCTLSRCIDETLKKSDYYKRKLAIGKFNTSSEMIKKGLSLIPLKFACSLPLRFLMQASAVVRIYLDGTVQISHSGAEMGQGINTKMVQVASQVLELDMDKIHIIENSTDQCPNVIATGASIGSDLNGAAIKQACEDLKRRLNPYRGDTWQKTVEAAFLDRVSLTATGFYDWSSCSYDGEKNKGIFTDYFTFGAGCVEVEVNCLTGRISVEKATIVIDVGKSLNPALDVGQIEGAFIQGLGYVTTEQLLVDAETGKLITDNASNYKIPCFADIPKDFNITLLEHNGEGPTGPVYSSKGIGEPPLLIGACGVLTAIRQAVAAYRQQNGDTSWVQIDPPATVDKIRLAAAYGGNHAKNNGLDKGLIQM